jgi:hypothetical protein
METATEETVKSAAEPVVRKLVARAVGVAIATSATGVGAAVLGTAAKELAQALLDSTSAMEAKLDRIIAEPLQSALAGLNDIVRAQFTTENELQRVDNDLSALFRNLQKAATLAGRTDPSQRLLIRAVQAYVAALEAGGGPYVAVIVREFREIAASLKSAADALDEQRRHEPELVFSKDEYEGAWMQALSYGNAGGVIGMAAMEDKHLSAHAAQAAEAASMRRTAEDLELYCVFVEKLRDRRLEFLGAVKE